MKISYPHPNLMHVNQIMHKFLANTKLSPENLRKIISIQLFTEAEGTDGLKISLTKSVRALVADRLQKHQQVGTGHTGTCNACSLSMVVWSTQLAESQQSEGQGHLGGKGANCGCCLCISFARPSVIHARWALK